MGSSLSRPERSLVIHRHGHHHLAASVCAVNGWRMSMEDAHCMHTSTPEIGNPHSTFGVFDGHINDTCAKLCAAALPKAIERLPRPLCKTSLEGTFIDIDTTYLADDRDGGTTAALVVIEPMTAASFSCTVCNLGDSRVIIVRRGEIVFATVDHKPSDPRELARIEAAGGRVELERINGDLAMSRSFGDGRYKMGQRGPANEMVSCIPDISTLELLPDDIVIIACDGVFEAGWENADLATFVSQQLNSPNASPDVAVACAAVCEEAMRRGSKDNITCMIVKMCALGLEGLARYGPRSFVPGPPPFLRTDEPARAQFAVMCEEGGMTVADALSRRYEMLSNRTALIAPHFNELEAAAFASLTEEEVNAELEFFGTGPPLEADAARRRQWFENLWLTEEELQRRAQDAVAAGTLPPRRPSTAPPLRDPAADSTADTSSVASSTGTAGGGASAAVANG